jgi:hypothetical protein
MVILAQLRNRNIKIAIARKVTWNIPMTKYIILPTRLGPWDFKIPDIVHHN